MKTLVKYLICLTTVGLLAAGCGPAKKEESEEVSPNIKARFITLEGRTMDELGDDEKVTSYEDYLAQNRVKMLRFIHQQRKIRTGSPWFWWKYKWIKTTKLLQTSITPVTREWTSEADTGTTERDQAQMLEALNSVNFKLYANIRAKVIPEKDHLFLARYAGEPLERIIDTVVWGYCQAKGASYFGKIPIEKCSENINAGGEWVFGEVKAFFENDGIEISSFGYIAGLQFVDPNHQSLIDGIFEARNDILIANNELEIQRKKNERTIMDAQAERDKALAIWAAKDAVLLRTELELMRIGLERDTAAVAKWKGDVPEMLPEGSDMLYFMRPRPNADLMVVKQLVSGTHPELDQMAITYVEKAKVQLEESIRINQEAADKNL